MTKNYQMERQHVTFPNNPQVVKQTSPHEVPQAQHAVKFAYPPQVQNRNMENIHPPQVYFHQNTPNFMNQTAPQVITQQGWFPPPPHHLQQPHINMRTPHNHQITINNLPPMNQNSPHLHLQRANSVQNLHHRDYSQPDRIITSTKIDPACNNEE